MSSGGKGGGGQTIGYKYFMGLHMGICRGPVNSLVETQVGERKAWPLSVTTVSGGGTSIFLLGASEDGTVVSDEYTPYTYVTSTPDPVTASSTISINAPELFGGEKKEGGIVGSCDVMMGEATQGVNSRLAAMLGDGLIGAFRGVLTLFFDGMVSAMNPYPKPWRFRVRRSTMGWDGDVFAPDSARIVQTVVVDGQTLEIHSMNPAHIIYECLTNRDWGRGLAREFIDSESFNCAADELYAEGFGLCLPWSRQNTVEAFVQIVIDHIGAVLYPSRETGLLKLRLIRGDYDVNLLSTYSTDNAILEIQEDEENSAEALISEIIVSFTDPITGDKVQTRAQNLGVMQAVGAINSKSVDYLGLPTHALANRVAQRDLKVHSTSLRRLNIKMNRQAWRLAPGDAFKLTDARRGIDSMVLRVGKVEEDPDSSIRVSAVQDVFGLPSTSYVGIPEDVVLPTNTPSPAAFTAIYEVTYWDLVRRLSTSDFAALTDTETYIYLLAAKPAVGFSLNYSVYTGVPAKEPTIKGTGNWSPAGALTSGISSMQFYLFVAIGSLPETITVGSPGMVENEIVRIDSYDFATGKVGISRGCVDTLPQAHPAGVPFWVLDVGAGLDRTRYTQSETILGRALTNTSSGQLHPSLAAEVSITTASRFPRPYPPARMKINSVGFADITVVPPAPVLTWVARNRVSQNDVILHQLNSGVTAEAGTTYTVQVRLQSDNSLVRTVTGLTVLTWTYLEADWITDGSPEQVFFDLFSVRGGWDSWQKYHIPVRIKANGWGLNWGNNWGGS